jgi:putative phage-type endonuclease
MENAKCYAPQILVGTEGLPREQWLEYRRKGIGGSDAAAVLGISPFRTGRDLYYDKLNIVTADDAENWVQLEVGTLLEPLVAKIFAHKTGYKIYRRPFMFQHPLYPWMLADLDYMVELPDDTTAILEIKTTNYREIWYSPVNEYDDVLENEQIKHNQSILTMKHPVAGEVRVVGHANKYDKKQ